MNFAAIVKESFRAIMRNRMRSFLTCVGIVVGVAAVILVPALGNCAKVLMIRQLEAFGTNVITISPKDNRIGAVSSGSGVGETLSVGDAEAIRRRLPDFVSMVSPVVNPSSTQLIRGNRNWSSDVKGVGEDYLAIVRHSVDVGRFIDETDIKRSRRVCVIGTTVRDRLFGGGVNPVGESVRIGDMPFRVIGLLRRKGTSLFGHDQDDTVVLPYTTALSVLDGSEFRSVDGILIQTRSMDTLDPAEKSLRGLLRTRHRIRDGEEDDFTVSDSVLVVSTVSSVSMILKILMSVIAAIALGVGGIGVMNIMLVSVAERVGEIGIRTALGAHPRDILRQFVFEAVALSSLGGLVGLLVGGGIACAIGIFAGCPDSFDASHAIMAIAVSAFVGLFFGFYPAYKASRLDPIQCLRKLK